MSVALQLFREHSGHISALLFKRENFDEDFDPGFVWSGLHCASYFGIIELVATLIEMGGYDLNGGDFCGRSALSLAVIQGHEDVVKILLEQEEVNPDKPNYHRGTPSYLPLRLGVRVR